MWAVFSGQALASTESATSGQSATFQCLSAVPDRLGRGFKHKTSVKTTGGDGYLCQLNLFEIPSIFELNRLKSKNSRGKKLAINSTWGCWTRILLTKSTSSNLQAYPAEGFRLDLLELLCRVRFIWRFRNSDLYFSQLVMGFAGLFCFHNSKENTSPHLWTFKRCKWLRRHDKKSICQTDRNQHAFYAYVCVRDIVYLYVYTYT